MKKAVGIIVALTMLVGCSQVVSKSEKHISINHDNAVFASTIHEMATKHCAQFGKVAIPSMSSGGGMPTTTFRCE